MTFVRHDPPAEEGPRTPVSSLMRGDRIWVEPHGWLTVHHVSLDPITARVHFEDGSLEPWRDYRPSNTPVQRQAPDLPLQSPMGRPGVYMAVGDDMAAPVARCDRQGG